MRRQRDRERVDSRAAKRSLLPHELHPERCGIMYGLVLLCDAQGIPSRATAMTPKPKCEELQRLRNEAKSALLQAKRVNRFGHLTDAELQQEAHRKVDAMIQHLLVGHSGEPCPAGDRPIVKSHEPEREVVYDIFRGASTKDAMWVEAVAGLTSARRRMEEIARKSPAQYFVFDHESHAIIARTDTRMSTRALHPRKSET